MSERDFERLKRTPVPEPGEEARARAHAAAMEAFDEAQEKKSARAERDVKGFARSGRPTSASPSWAWRTIMQNRMALGGAAACLVAAPLAAILLVEGEHGVRPDAGGGRIVRQAEAPPSPVTKPEADAETARSRDALAAAPAEPPPPPVAHQRFSTTRAPEAKIAVPPAPSPRVGEIAPQFETGRDRFVDGARNGVKITAQEPVSTFSIDADTASYAWVRRALSQGRAPAPEEVRVEELINYFPYDYPRPANAATPFRPTVAVYPTPWNRDTRIVHVGIKGFDGATTVRPKANLVFLIDVSGSMAAADKLPLVKTSLKLLLDRLAPDDSVAIVTYAGGTGVALEPTKASDRETVTAAIDRLSSGGSTAGAAGIEEAYRLARKNFDPKGVNRVLLATDGDFNVGVSDDDGLTRLVERERKSGVFLSVLGFGQGNYNDALMQRLAQNGDGTAAYIDQLEEAQKVLAEEATSTLFPIAKDVKIRVEFNPSTVSEYRLIGYETRMLKREDFKDDRVDAGEVGSGAAVTALYEITPAGSPARLTEDLRYGAPAAAPAPSGAQEYGFLKLRYKLPGEDASRLIEQPIGRSLELDTVAGATDDVRFAAAVAAFGQKLEGARELAGMGWDRIDELAQGARGADPWGYRAGFVRLVGLAKAVARQ